METLSSFLFPLLGYFSGSLPFSVWVTHLAKGVDVRSAGSGHATTTNTIRQAGFGWGALVAILDLAKGFIPTLLAVNYSNETWVIVLTAALGVVGHCWPVFPQSFPSAVAAPGVEDAPVWAFPAAQIPSDEVRGAASALPLPPGLPQVPDVEAARRGGSSAALRDMPPRSASTILSTRRRGTAD